MSILGWIILGLISGFIASKIVNKSGEGFFLDIVLGIVGAIVGGFIFTAVGASGITGFNLYSMVVAVIGAIVVLVIYHAEPGSVTAQALAELDDRFDAEAAAAAGAAVGLATVPFALATGGYYGYYRYYGYHGPYYYY